METHGVIYISFHFPSRLFSRVFCGDRNPVSDCTTNKKLIPHGMMEMVRFAQTEIVRIAKKGK